MAAAKTPLKVTKELLGIAEGCVTKLTQAQSACMLCVYIKCGYR